MTKKTTHNRNYQNILKEFNFNKHWYILALILIVVGVLGKFLMFLGIIIFAYFGIKWYLNKKKK